VLCSSTCVFASVNNVLVVTSHCILNLHFESDQFMMLIIIIFISSPSSVSLRSPVCVAPNVWKTPCLGILILHILCKYCSCWAPLCSFILSVAEFISSYFHVLPVMCLSWLILNISFWHIDCLSCYSSSLPSAVVLWDFGCFSFPVFHCKLLF
jgi:hypothetical protein